MSIKNFCLMEGDVVSLEHIVRHQSSIYFWGSMNLLSQVATAEKEKKYGRGIIRQIIAADKGMHDAHSTFIICILFSLYIKYYCYSM